MDFTEFREKFGISQDKLHKLTLEAHDLYVHELQNQEDFAEEYPDEEYEPDFGSWRQEMLYGFLQLLISDEEEDD